MNLPSAREAHEGLTAMAVAVVLTLGLIATTAIATHWFGVLGGVLTLLFLIGTFGVEEYEPGSTRTVFAGTLFAVFGIAIGSDTPWLVMDLAWVMIATGVILALKDTVGHFRGSAA